MVETASMQQTDVIDKETAKSLFVEMKNCGSDRERFFKELYEHYNSHKPQFTSASRLDLEGFRRLKFTYTLVLLAYDRGSEHILDKYELMKKDPDKFFAAAQRTLNHKSQAFLSEVNSAESSIRWARSLDPLLGPQGYSDIYDEAKTLLKNVNQLRNPEDIYKYIHFRINLALQSGLGAYEFTKSMFSCTLVLVLKELGPRRYEKFSKLFKEDAIQFYIEAKKHLSSKGRKVLQSIEGIASTSYLLTKIRQDKAEDEPITENIYEQSLVYEELGILNIILSRALNTVSRKKVFQALREHLFLENHNLFSNYEQYRLRKIVLTLFLIQQEFDTRHIKLFTRLFERDPEMFVSKAYDRLTVQSQSILDDLDNIYTSSRLTAISGNQINPLCVQPGQRFTTTDLELNEFARQQNPRHSFAVTLVHLAREIIRRLQQGDLTPNRANGIFTTLVGKFVPQFSNP